MKTVQKMEFTDTFTEEILNGKLHFLCCGNLCFSAYSRSMKQKQSFGGVL